jgi:hypothetical protein
LIKANQLTARPKERLLTEGPVNATAPSTAVPPSSAMAARIAISAPAVAVRASSSDPSGQRVAFDRSRNGASTEEGNVIVVLPSDGPPSNVTAQLQAAEHMRLSQQMQIDAQNEANRRRQAEARNGMILQNVCTSSRLRCSCADLPTIVPDDASPTSATTTASNAITARTSSCHPYKR